MANTKISELTAVTALAGTDVFPVVDVSASTTNKVSVTDLLRNAPAGTATAPSIASADDQNTGILFPATESIGVSTAGTQRLVIDSSGNCGIGTTSPGTKLDVNDGSANCTIRARTGTGFSSFLSLLPNGSGTGVALAANADSSAQLFNQLNSHLTFGTNNTERLRIDSSGQVGIGTTSPSAALEVVQTSDMAVFASTTGTNNSARFEARSGNGTTSGKYAYVRFNNNDTNNQRYDIGTYGTDNLTFRDVKAGSTRMTLDTSGNVGIGTTTPSQILELKAATPRLCLNGSTSNSSKGIEFEHNGTTSGSITHNHATGPLTISSGDNGSGYFINFKTDNSERMRIDSSGRLLVGTTGSDQDALLTVARTGDGGSSPSTISSATVATFRATGGLSHEAHVSILGGSTGASQLNLGDRDDEDVASIRYDHNNNFMQFNASATERMRIDSSGRVGIGTTSPSAPLDVVGNDGIAIQSSAQTNEFLIRPSSGSADGIRFTQAGGAGDRMAIDSSGNVGIGTTAPNSLLEIRGTSDGQNVLHLSNTAGSSDGGAENQLRVTCNGNTNWGNLDIQAYQTIFTQNNTERMRIDSSGRLLVGTSTARTDFYSGSLGADIQLEDSSYCAYSAYVTNGNGAFIFGRGNPVSGSVVGNLSWMADDGTDEVECARISGQIDGTPGSNDMPGRLVFSTTADGASSATERMKISNDGSLRVQGVYDFTLASSANVHVDSGGLIRRVTSSAKYKTNIETIEDSYADALLNCRPVWYQSTCEGDNPDYGWWGFIAEEVAEIDPRLVHWKTTNVTHNEDGQAVEAPCDPEAEGVLYDRFVPHLVNLIKRQKTRIETLEAQHADLLARVTALEAG